MKLMTRDSTPREFQKVYRKGDVVYVPHFRGSDVFVGPGYPRFTKQLRFFGTKTPPLSLPHLRPFFFTPASSSIVFPSASLDSPSPQVGRNDSSPPPKTASLGSIFLPRPIFKPRFAIGKFQKSKAIAPRFDPPLKPGFMASPSRSNKDLFSP